MSEPLPPIGHNGGEPLDDDKDDYTGPHYCKYCRHWRPPLDWDVRAYEAFQLGISRRRVRRPSGTCDRVLMLKGKPLSFAATVDNFSCFNFSAKPPEPPQWRPELAYVKVYEDDDVVWEGKAKDLPEEYR